MNHRLDKASAPAVLIGALLFLVGGVFLGNVFIAIGQVVMLAGIALAVKQSGWSVVDPRNLRASAVWLGVFVAVAVVSVVANLPLVEDPVGHLKKLRYFVIFLIALCVPGLFKDLIERLDKRRLLMAIWLGTLLIAAAIGFVGWWRGDHPLHGLDVADAERFSGLYGGVMTFAYTLQFSVVALAIFVTKPRLWERISRLPLWIPVVATAVAGGALYLTYTRGAMLGVVVGFVAHAMMRSRWLVVLVLAVGIAGGTYAYLDQSRYFVFKSSLRASHWKAASLAFAERPIFGFGFRNFELHSAELKERLGFEEDKFRRIDGKRESYFAKGHAHNNYLEALASTGVLGGIAFLGFCFCWFREAWRSDHAAIFVPLIAAFLVSGFFENTFFDSEVLNCILLIYLFSQIVFSLEAEGSGNQSSSSSSSPSSSSAGTTTTET